jgi:hypothetical protein
MTDERETAWFRLHDALEAWPGWRVTPADYQAEEKPWPRWHVTVHDAAVRGRQARRAAVEGTGATEVEALEALSARLEVRMKVMR